MGGDDEEAKETGSVDWLLRELARTPSKEPDPERIGRFRVLGRLGAGGMGIVYRAEDEALGRAVAVKVLPPDARSDAERRKRLLREARAAAAVTHPNLAAVYEVGEADGHMYIAMELVEGQSLRALIEKGLSREQALQIGLQIARATARAHRAGIVHRDLKPENVMVTEDGHAKVLDFGIAKLRVPDGASALASAETVTHEGRVMGTPAYMAPEQARGREVTPATDVFAFGVMLYEMLAGRRPFAGSTVADITSAIDKGPPPPILPSLDSFLLQCLAPDAADRPKDGDALVRALATNDEPFADVRTPESSISATPPRRRWMILALGAVLLVGIGIWTIRGKPATPTAPAPVTAAPTTTRIIDLPVPPTTVPEAAAEYAAGLQLYRDDNWLSAKDHFERAAKLDPLMAAAHLRSAIMIWGPAQSSAAMHEHFGQAQALRSRLTPRDQAFADALEPLLMRSRQDKAEAMRRLEAFYVRYPKDMEIISFLSWFVGNGEPARALGYADIGFALDPGDATVLENRGHALGRLDRPAEAREAFEKSVALSLTNWNAVAALADMDGPEGRCADFERHARTLAERRRVPDEYLVGAYVANGKSSEAIDEVVKQHVATEARPSREKRSLWYGASLALAHGDFAAAHAFAMREEKLVNEDEELGRDLTVRTEVATFLVVAALETEDAAEALRAARFYDSRASEWAGSVWNDSAWIHRIAASGDASRLSLFEATQERKADELIETKTLNPLETWYQQHAAAVVTAHDAGRVLEILGRFGPLNREASEYDAIAGHVYFVAGRMDDALPFLRRAAVSCLQLSAPYERMRASWELGEALHAKSDDDGACRAYGEIVKWWGDAKPRSVTAEKARARIKALRCP